MENKIKGMKTGLFDIKGILTFVIFVVMFFVTNTVIEEMAKNNTSTEGWVLIAIQLIVYIVFIVAMYATILKDTLIRIIWTMKNEGKNVFKVALKSMAVYLVLSFVLNLIGKSIIESMSDLEVGSSVNQDTIGLVFNSSVMGAVTISLLVMFAAPIVEELAFRRGLLGSVSAVEHKLTRVLVSGLSIFLFGAMHVYSNGDWQNIIPYLTMAVIVTHIYRKYNDNVTYTIATHMFINIFSIVLMIFAT